VGISSVEDLETFLVIALQAGRQVNKEEIVSKVTEMRNSIPSWMWDEVKEVR